MNFVRRLIVTGLDSNLFIYFLEGNLQFGGYAKEVFLSIEKGDLDACASELVFFEVLSSKHLNDSTATKAKKTLESLPIRYYPADKTVLIEASRLRREYGLGVLDSVHVASALTSGCEKFITNDERLTKKKVPSISIIGL